MMSITTAKFAVNARGRLKAKVNYPGCAHIIWRCRVMARLNKRVKERKGSEKSKLLEKKLLSRMVEEL